MAISSEVFGDVELSYRLPSLTLGLLGFAAIIWFAKNYDQSKTNLLALAVALVSFLTAYDWWMSMQMAHLDTGVAMFTGLAILSLLVFAQLQEGKYLIISGVALGLGILSKGPPAVVFVFPALYLLIIKKLSIKNLLILFTSAFVTLLPWLVPLSLEHGIDTFWKMYFGSYLGDPASTKLGGSVGGTADLSQAAPIYWYLRWWFDSLRPGIYIFGSLFVTEVIRKKLTWQKASLLIFTLGTFILFSVAGSKVWWYVLPAMMGMMGYIYLAARDYLEDNANNQLNLALAIVVGSMPLLLFRSNSIALGYGLLITGLCFIILQVKSLPKLESNTRQLLFAASTLFSLMAFYFKFPKVNPPYPQMEQIGAAYFALPKPKCLWLEPELHYEAILYYSKAGNIRYLTEDAMLNKDCVNYLVSDLEQPLDVVSQIDGITLYQLEDVN